MNKEVWKRNLFYLSIAQFIYRLGTRSLIPFLPLFIKDIGKTSLEETALWSGWIFASPFIISFFTTPFWGTVGDKHGRKIIAILSMLGFALSQMAMSFSTSLLFLLIASSVQELFGGAYPAAISLTASNTPKEKTADALGYLQFANSLGNVVGPILGGVLADLLGFRIVLFFVGSIVALSSLIIVFMVKEQTIVKEQSRQSLTANLKYFFNNKALIACGLLLLAYTLSVTIMRPGFTLFVNSQFYSVKGSSLAGLLLGIFGAAGSVSSAILVWLNKLFTVKSNLLMSFLFAGILFLITPLITNLYLFSLSLFALGFMLGVILPLIYTFMNLATVQTRKAGVLGVGASFQMTGNLTGPIISGIIASWLGIFYTFILSGVLLMLALFLIGYITNNNSDEER